MGTMSKERHFLTPDLAREICTRLAAGETVRSICKSPGFPSEMAVRNWALNNVNGFAAQYARARMLGWYSLADEIIDASRERCEATREVTRSDGSNEIISYDDVNRARLRVDTIKWTLAKMLPKIYGTLINVVEDESGEITIEGGLPDYSRESRD